MLAFSQSVISDRLKALTRALDGGSTGGYLMIYSGTRPSTGAAVTTQVLLAQCPFPKPSLLSVVGNTLTLNNPTTILSSATGTATWARMTDSNGVFIADMDAGDSTTNPSAECQLSQALIYLGGEVIVTLGSLVES